ncbi:hypothetical protein AXF42_Ash015274 [Apostasia shenzhenica]|uniref:Uncharacterized protein n=1 Tax=Apostasia shenzhenica TaxID=1088818 RepID=A0A2I0ALQ7_9ASPA|nr:hypothetical protein AXF42_Ash015274 [Apostasia shenzhenica]
MMELAVKTVLAAAAAAAAAEREEARVSAVRGIRRLLAVRRIYWKLRAEIRRRSGKCRRFSSRYDPLSYALNFDDGVSSVFLPPVNLSEA